MDIVFLPHSATRAGIKGFLCHLFTLHVVMATTNKQLFKEPWLSQVKGTFPKNLKAKYILS